jgi:acid stress chaperone HdeB
MKNANHMLFGLVLAAVPSAACLAQTTIDVAKITCEQLVLMNVADPDHIAIWLSGYYTGKRNTTKVDVEQLKDTARKVRSYCLYNKGTVMEAVESLMATK